MIEGQEEHARAMISQTQARVMWIGLQALHRTGRVKERREGTLYEGNQARAVPRVQDRRAGPAAHLSPEPPGPAAEALAEHGENSFAKSEMAKLLFAP